MSALTDQILVLLAVIGSGIAFGKISIRGVSLGTCGVVFSALVAGHFGFVIPKLLGVAGVVIFAYCLGISAGPGFGAMFLKKGRVLLTMAVAMLLSAMLCTWAIAVVLNLTPDLACGLLAGSMTSTPALATAVEHLPADSDVTVGFGVAYPFGVVGVILFVQLVPRLFGRSEQLEDSSENGNRIQRILVEVTNPNVAGKRLRDLGVLSRANCQVSRVVVDEQLKPIPSSFSLQLHQRILVIGREKNIPAVIEVLGARCEGTQYMLDVERQRRRVVVTSKQLIGKSLRELHLLSRHGVTISRIGRQNIEFVPSSDERIQFGDALTAVGEPEDLERFTEAAGHRERTLDETNLVSLAFGLLLGILAGRVEFGLGGNSISLGTAGGPLLVGLILGGVGAIGPFVGRIPRAARFLLAEIGLAMFLAQAGSQAGGNLWKVIQANGLELCMASIIIVLVPMFTGYLIARFCLKLSHFETFGGICGAMTSTPGLGAITATTDESTPATSYATVYPMALILITILVPILIVLVT